MTRKGVGNLGVAKAAAAAAVVGAGALLAAMAFVPAAGTAGPAAPASWAQLDGFESPGWPDPNLWLVPDELTAMWRPSGCRVRSGDRALRAFAGPRGRAEAPCDQAIAGAVLSQVVMRLDLRQASRATRLDLFFDLWVNLAPAEGAGVFVHLRVPEADGSLRRVPVFGATSQSGLWAFPMRRLDLIDLDDIRTPGPPIDLRGGLWELEWSAFAPAGVPPGGGVYIDNVSLVWEPDPAVPVPTRQPTSTATRLTPCPTITRAPTLAPTSTGSATAQATRTPGRAFLPLLSYPAGMFSPATETSHPPDTATATIDSGGKATATGGPTAILPSTTPGTEATATVGGAASATPAPTGAASSRATPTGTGTALTPTPLPVRVHVPLVLRAAPLGGPAGGG